MCKAIGQVFIIPKKDGTPRLVFNGSDINYLFKNANYPLPAVQYALAAGGKYFSKTDLYHAFMHFPIVEKLKPYFCFRSPDGQLYRWDVMIWGTNFAPAFM